MQVKTLYDRTDLVHLTTATVRHVVLLGITLVTLLLLVFLGDVRISLIAALTIPCSLLFAFSLMVLTGRSANLISLGAVDFGILVDAALIVLENIYRRLHESKPGESAFETIANAAGEAVRPVLFSVLVIIVALIPLFTMQGVPGKIFGPMSVTYGFALTGAMLFSVFLAPVLSSFRGSKSSGRGEDARLVVWLRRVYDSSLRWTLSHKAVIGILAIVILVGSLALLPFLGGEFMPKLEEGNLWVRASMPNTISYSYATQLTDQMRAVFRKHSEVTTVVSQLGRPDDGTDPTSYFNAEFLVELKPFDQQGCRQAAAIDPTTDMSCAIADVPRHLL